jgi:hypothetical protein
VAVFKPKFVLIQIKWVDAIFLPKFSLGFNFQLLLAHDFADYVVEGLAFPPRIMIYLQVREKLCATISH